MDKLGNTLIFLCEHLEKASKTHILKFIFIIEEFSIMKFGVPFFNLRFDLWKLGPVSKDLFVELSEELNLLDPYIKREVRDGATLIFPKMKFSDDEFSDNEIKLLNEIIDRFKYCTATELINFTHKKNSPWYNTAMRNGVLDLLETGKITTTDLEINLAEIIEDDPEKLMMYNSHKEFLAQSKSLKAF